ncbi:MAG: TerB family tellurite resistance protein [Flavisolibacter sp.]
MTKQLMSNNTTFLSGYTDLEKGAYLGAIASLATADRVASPEEIDHLNQLSTAASLSEEQKQFVVRAATELNAEDLNECLDILKESELKYSLVTDLIAFARSDENISREEEESVHKIARYLGVNEKQYSLLGEFTEEVSTENVQSTDQDGGEPSFLTGGLKEKMQSAGINTGSLLKGLLAIAGPMLLSGMLNRRRGGGMMGGGMMGRGGLGSLIGMLGGGRGLGQSGGLLGKILGGMRR